MENYKININFCTYYLMMLDLVTYLSDVNFSVDSL